MTILLRSGRGVTLAGGGALEPEVLAQARAVAPVLAAADGGARHLLAAGLVPDLVAGDLDSLDPATAAALPPGVLHRIAEQDTTDFDKALRSIAAPFVVAVGFAGPRLDHLLASFNVLARHPRRACLLLGARDVAFLAPRSLTLRLDPGDRLSLFPLGPVRGASEGLRWPIEGLRLAPAGRVGTSNEVAAPEVRLTFSARRMLVILPAARLGAAISALVRPPEAAPPAP